MEEEEDKERSVELLSLEELQSETNILMADLPLGDNKVKPKKMKDKKFSKMRSVSGRQNMKKMKMNSQRGKRY